MDATQITPMVLKPLHTLFISVTGNYRFPVSVREELLWEVQIFEGGE
jgi:hypothetical protein